MSNNFFTTIVLAVIITGLAVFSWNPMDIFMPDATAMAIACTLLIVVAIFAAIVWRERTADERDVAHQAAAGRAAFIVGVGAITIGIAVQSFAHAVDLWLVGALVAMVIAKIGARAWHELRH